MNIKMKQLYEDTPTWEALKDAVNEITSRIMMESSVGSNEFETLKLTFLKEGRIKGIQLFINEIEQYASRTK